MNTVDVDRILDNMTNHLLELTEPPPDAWDAINNLFGDIEQILNALPEDLDLVVDVLGYLVPRVRYQHCTVIGQLTRYKSRLCKSRIDFLKDCEQKYQLLEISLSSMHLDGVLKSLSK